MAREIKPKKIFNESLYLLENGESDIVDYKKSAEGVSAEDLVAFANSEFGGSILVGVAEAARADGSQYGLAVGCEITDAVMLQLINKATSCIPPISVNIYPEVISGIQILRVDIASSPSKPHCTQKGIYNRRDGSRNRPLHPSELLAIFLHNEEVTFARKFQSAAEKITTDLGSLEKNLEKSISDMGDRLGWAEFRVNDSEDAIYQVLSHVRSLAYTVSDIELRVKAIFQQDKRPDPVKAIMEEKIISNFIKSISDDPNKIELIKAGGSLKFTVEGLEDSGFSEEEIREIISKAIRKIKSAHVKGREG